MKSNSIFLILTFLFPFGIFAQVPATTVHGQQMGETSADFLASHVDVKTKLAISCQGKIERSYKDFCKRISEAQLGKRVQIITEATHVIGDDKPIGKTGVVIQITDGWQWTFENNHLVKAVFSDYRDGVYSTFLEKSVKKYGDPTTQGTTDYQNGFGARYAMNSAMWVEPDGAVITLLEFPSELVGGVQVPARTEITVRTKEEFELQKKAGEINGPKL
jgi:hypothetical protein